MKKINTKRVNTIITEDDSKNNKGKDHTELFSIYKDALTNYHTVINEYKTIF